jgi:hypothetical protein
MRVNDPNDPNAKPALPMREVRVAPTWYMPPGALSGDTLVRTIQIDAAGQWWYFAGREPVRQITNEELFLAAAGTKK